MTALSVVLASALLASASAQVATETESSVPLVLREVGFDQNLGEAVSLDLAFRDELGNSVKLGDYFGEKPVLLALVYYECPMLCTLTLNGLVSALDTLTFNAGDEFEVVTVSFEPKETPEMAAAKKATYLKRYKRPGAEQGWHFLTGSEEAIAQLTKTVGFRYAWDELTGQYAHPSGIVVLTPDGRVARYLYGIEFAPKDLRFALIEASDGKIGSPVDQVVLFCYQYDPDTGKYGAAIMRILRVSAVLTLVAMGAFWIVMWRREKSKLRRTGGQGDQLQP